MIGHTFTTKHCGDVVVHGYKNRDNVFVTFLNTGTEIRTSKARLTRTERPALRDPEAATVFGVGRIGAGRHKGHHKGQDTKPYSIWRAMLRRCYYRGPQPRQASYDGCTVAPEWHSFQAFADWYEENYPRDGGRYQLDKDTILPGNKTYSPDRCRFVSQLDNLAARSGPGRGRTEQAAN